MSARQLWITAAGPLSITTQCLLAEVTGSAFYSLANPEDINAEEQLFMDLIDEEYTLHPFYGSRRTVHHLKSQGHQVNHIEEKKSLKLGQRCFVAWVTIS